MHVLEARFLLSGKWRKIRDTNPFGKIGRIFPPIFEIYGFQRSRNFSERDRPMLVSGLSICLGSFFNLAQGTRHFKRFVGL